MNLTKQSAPRIFSAVWMIGLFLSGFILAASPGMVPIFLGLAVIGLAPLILGSRPYRIFGVVAVLISLLLAYADYRAGLHYKAKRDAAMRQRTAERQAATNQPSLQTAKP